MDFKKRKKKFFRSFFRVIKGVESERSNFIDFKAISLFIFCSQYALKVGSIVKTSPFADVKAVGLK